MRNPVARGWLWTALVVGAFLMISATAEARPDWSRLETWDKNHGHRGAPAPDAMTAYQGSCGFGPYYVGQEFSFSHSVEYSFQVDEDHGYLIDCVQGTDAYFEFHGSSNGLFYYAVWGQLGNYS